MASMTTITRVCLGLALSLTLGSAALAQTASGGATVSPAFRATLDRFVQQGADVQHVAGGAIVTPASSIPQPGDAGLAAHTNTKLFIPAGLPGATPLAATPDSNAPPFGGYAYETPSSLACIYMLVTRAKGCNPNTFHTNFTGGGRAIAVVDAYDAPNVRSDLAKYSTQFGLPAVTASNFVVYYCGTTAGSCKASTASGATPPAYNSGWEGEISLDVQMARGVAPKATLYLVEASTNSFANLMIAIDKAKALVAAKGGGEVSMSFGSSEFSGQTSYDSHFTAGAAKVAFFASSGDDPSVGWPASSPNVVAVGGQSISRDPATLDLVGESSWDQQGTGPSVIYARPSFQSGIASIIGNHRAIPDVSAVANPETGVWVYISGQGGWFVFGGTSVASPVFAAISNASGHYSASTAAELKLIYDNLGNSSAYGDVTQGICGPHTGYWAGKGWDYCSGVGSPHTKVGK